MADAEAGNGAAAGVGRINEAPVQPSSGASAFRRQLPPATGPWPPVASLLLVSSLLLSQ